MKQGENEAKMILKSKGIEFNDLYQDDNSKENMPDLMFANGRFLEVTHTVHNNAPMLHPERYCPKSIHEELEIQTKIHDALNRLNSFDYYERDSRFNMTSAGKKQYEKDLKTVRRGVGYDPTQVDFRKQFSEFECSNPSYHFDVENIYETIEKKSGKYPNGDTDLFVFVVQSEFDWMIDTVEKRPKSFYKHTEKSPFQTIYICVWDFYGQEYILDNPLLFCITNGKEGIQGKLVSGFDRVRERGKRINEKGICNI